MAETKQTLRGVVAGATQNDTTNSGWKKWTLTFEDGESHNIIIPPDCSYVPKTGDDLVFFQGAYNSWVLDTRALGGEPKDGEPAQRRGRSSRGRSGGSSSSSGSKMSRDDYWRGKDEYERNTRDPKIEWQTYFDKVCQVYAAGLPHLTKPPKTVQGLDSLIDDAVAKADSIMALRNKAEQTDSEG